MQEQARIESDKDFEDSPRGMAERWTVEIEAARKELEKFHTDGDRITERYLDKRDDWARAESRVNLFWSTMKVLLSMLYARPPRASVARSFLDGDDDQARVAGTILQRLLNRSFDDNVSSWDAAVRQAIEDWLVVGLGQVWLRYEVETEEREEPAQIDPMTGAELVPASTVEAIVEEDAPVDYIYWKDFFWSPARTWAEVRWVARRVYMTRDKLVARFGEEIGRAVPLQSTTPTADKDQRPRHDPWAAAEVFEIWCKDTEKVYWLAKGFDVILDYKSDPLEIEGFFPCPKPLCANVTSSNFLPRADYVFAQDQFDELDEINTRITWLTRAAKVIGVYDKAADGLQRMFQQATENQLIPVDNWAMFAESGGIKGKIDWVPIEAVVNAIERLRVYRSDKTQQIYEVLGISDVMRGASKASETLGAQRMKAQFGATRIQLMQFYIAEWISNALRIKAEIICKHWQPDTIVTRSNIMRTPDAQLAGPAIQLLKDEEMSEYRINVEADSMAALDWDSERDSAVQFLSGLGAFVSQVQPMVAAMPGSGPFLLRLLQWGVSKFRVSTEIESVLDQAIAGAQQELATPKPPPPTPPEILIEAEKIKSNERIAQMEVQSEEKVAALKATVDLQKVEMQQRFKNVEEQFQQISGILATLPHTSQVMQLDEIKNLVAQNKMDTDSQLSTVMSAVNRKRKRIPIRDAMGEIVEVREVDDEDAGGMPAPIQVGPPGSQAMN